MMMKTTYEYVLRFCIFCIVYLIDDTGGISTMSSSPTPTISSNITTDMTGSTTDSTNVVSSTTVNTTLTPSTVETTNNVTPMIVGIAVGVGVIAVAILVTAITFAVLQHKKVHPSDAETIFSDSASESDYDSRPTTASHIFIDQADDVPSRPVTMTPFELRKLFVETFPYEKWKPGYDGNLRPRMPLRFVHPSRYRRTKFEETEFRKKIYQFEMTENLTISRPPSSTFMRSPRSMSYSMTTLDPVPERIYQNGVLHTESGELFRSETYGNDEASVTEHAIPNAKSSPCDNVDTIAVVHSQTLDIVNENNPNNSKGSILNRASSGSSAKDSEEKGKLIREIEQTADNSDSKQSADVNGLEQGQNTQDNIAQRDNMAMLEQAQSKVEPDKVNGHLEIENYDDIMTTEL